jgi:hypothetical protein
MMGSSEPANLCEWKAPEKSGAEGRLFTCGRPGRATFERKRLRVPDEVIDSWAKGLPDTEVLHIVSLLGRKKDDFSEFDYYPFRSLEEPGAQPTFQEWLDERYGQRFVVHEYPTVDAQGIPPDVLATVTRQVISLLEGGCTVVIVDSAGAERTARICEKIGYTRANRTARS